MNQIKIWFKHSLFVRKKKLPDHHHHHHLHHYLLIYLFIYLFFENHKGIEILFWLFEITMTITMIWLAMVDSIERVYSRLYVIDYCSCFSRSRAEFLSFGHFQYSAEGCFSLKITAIYTKTNYYNYCEQRWPGCVVYRWLPSCRK